MSIQDALSFIRHCRQNAPGDTPTDKYSSVAGLDDFVEVAAKEGFDFSARELRQAHQIDWRMRLRHYSDSLLDN